MSRCNRGLGRLLWLAGVVLCVLCVGAQADIIVQYDFSTSNNVPADATNDVPNAVAAHVTAQNFAGAPGLLNWANDVGWDGSVVTGVCRKADNWPTGGIDDTKWYGFSVALENGWAMDVTTLAFDMYKKQDGSPSNFQVRCSINGGAFANFGSSNFTTPTNVWTHHDVTNPLSAVTGTIDFRIYPYNAPMPGRSLRIDNVTLNGTLRTDLVPFPIGEVSFSVQSAFQLGFQSATTAVYTVQYRDSLLSGSWSDVPGLSGVVGNGSQLLLADTNSVGITQRFYQVKGQLQ